MWINGELCEADPRFLEHMQSAVQGRETKQRLSAYDGADDVPTMVQQITDTGVAVIRMHGPMVRQESMFWANYPTLMRDLDTLESREDITGAVIDFDSPGGMVMGSVEASDRITQFGKPIVAYASGFMTSAAYKLACFCNEIYAATSAEIGNIGTRFSLLDASKAFELAGLEKLEFTTGPFKALGSIGTEVTEDQREFLQSWIQRSHQHFQHALQVRGLSPEQSAAVSDGRWWGSAEAQTLGLIDGITSLAEVLGMVPQSRSVSQIKSARTRSRSAVQESEMSKGTDQPATGSQSSQETESGNQPTQQAPAQAAPAAPATQQQPAVQNVTQTAATLPQLKAACPGATSDFLLQQLEAGSTVASAQTAFILHQQQLLADRQEQQQAAAVAGSPAPQGAQRLQNDGTQSSADGTDPVRQFETLVTDQVKQGIDRQSALQAVIIEHGELYSQYRGALSAMGPDDFARRRRRLNGGRLALTK